MEEQTYNPIINDIENNIKNDIVINNNFVKEFILNSLFPNLESPEYILFKLNVYSVGLRIHLVVFTFLQLLLYSLYTSNNTNKLFINLITLSNLNIFWLLFSLVLFYCTKKIDVELENLKNKNLEINNLVNSNKLLILISQFWTIICGIRIIEFICWIVSLNGFVNLLPYFAKNNDLTTTQIILLSLTIGYQSFIINIICHGKLRIYALKLYS